MATSSFLRFVERILWLAAFVALGWCGFAFCEAHLYQLIEGRRLDDALERANAQASAARRDTPAPRPGRDAVPFASAAPAPPDDRPSEDGDPVPSLVAPAPLRKTWVAGRLEIPRLRFSAIVREGEDATTLRLAVGHVPGTALPGEPGNVALAGHRDTFFRCLEHVRKGDMLRLTTLDGTFDYRVTGARVVDPSDTQLLDPTPGQTLTLVTCYPFRYVGPAPKRFVVLASKAVARARPGLKRSTLGLTRTRP